MAGKRYLFIVLLSTWSFGARVVSTSPQVTELLFQLEKGKEVVGSVQPANFPAEAMSVSSIGPLFRPNVETTLRLDPDIVILDDSLRQTAYQSAIKALGLRTMHIHIESVDGLINAIKQLLVSVFSLPTHPKLKALEECISGLSPLSPFRFLALTWTDPPIAYGHSTFVSDLITRLGGVNLVPSSLNQPYPILSTEWLINNQPDHIFFMANSESDATASRDKIHFWWPNQRLQTTPIHAEHFGRDSLTPFRNLTKLGLLKSIPRSCGAL